MRGVRKALSRSRPTVLAAMACSALLPMSPLARAQQSDSSRATRIELTRADVFARKGWKSTEIQISGLYLGMLRREAIVASRTYGFQLMQYGTPAFNLLPCSDNSYCFLGGARGYDSDDVGIHLGKMSEIVQIDLNIRPVELRGRILRELKGQTRRFFYDSYTDGLRLELFGQETSRDLVEGRFGSKFKDTRYTYGTRGLSITVSPRQPKKDQAPELVTFSLIPPGSSPVR